MNLLQTELGTYYIPTGELISLIDYAQDQLHEGLPHSYLNIYIERLHETPDNLLQRLPYISIAFFTIGQFETILNMLFKTEGGFKQGLKSYLRCSPNLKPPITIKQGDKIISKYSDSLMLRIESHPATEFASQFKPTVYHEEPID